MMAKGLSIVRLLAAALLLTGASVQAAPTDLEVTNSPHVARATFRDDFTTTLDTANIWRCQYSCPVIETEKARFRLQSGIEPNNLGSFSKVRYMPSRFTSGSFTVRFALTARPEDQAVWWGVALWDETFGIDQFNEINFGYTTDQSYNHSSLRFESARRGVADFIQVDTHVNLYDEQWHEATLEYDSAHVAFYFDGEFMGEFTDTTFIPTDPMDLILGPRLVTGSDPLVAGFTESIDWVEITS